MYPKVLSEEETLHHVTQGRSIARFGDGELKLMLGRKCVSQDWSDQLQTELRNIVHNVTPKCLIGIPSLDDRNPKHFVWWTYKEKFERFIHPKAVYGSAFITRPDNAPWINTPAYFDEMEALWGNQEVILVANGKRSITKGFLEALGATVHWVECSYKNSYREIDDLERKVRALKPKRVILCAGPTATCLAYRLSDTKHAIDLGHIGMFWRKYTDDFIEQREINKKTGEVEPNP